MEVDERCAERSKFRVSAPHFEALAWVLAVGSHLQVQSHSYAGVDGIRNIASSALQVLPRIRYQDGRLRVLVEPLLNSTVVTSLFGRYVFSALGLLVVINIAHVPVGYVLGRLLRGGGGSS